VTIPDVALTRMSQLKIGLLLAVLNEHIALEESILCLSGVAGSGRLDTMLIANPQRDFPWFRTQNVEDAQESIATRELVRVIDVAMRLSREGREGRPLGTIFVIGDPEVLGPHLRQLVLNPCEGHPQKSRNIHDDTLFETLREFAALDGAFVVNKRGIVESAGTYLDAPVPKTRILSGLGARHTAAAAVTAATEAIAVVISESSGTVTVFHEGKQILALEKTQPQGKPISNS
jgi:DNA integrity scanning protein DisA with diadenylate cyclase activity